ncbi:MAG: adenylate/guanylate cyclase domain-containing protein [Cyanobacteria bacterium P01_G01_bin.39]
MSLLNKFTIKSRLMSLLFAVSFSSLLIVGVLSYLQFRKAILDEVKEKTLGVQSAKKSEIELYMRDLRSHVEILSEDRLVVDSMVEFNSAYEALKDEIIPDNWLDGIEKYYKTQFLPRLSDNIQGEQVFTNYSPTTQVSQYLQYHYVANNSYDLGEKSKLIDARDGSDYTEFHKKYHPAFSRLAAKFGYYDIFLINIEQQEIVYTVEKETDYATSLENGSYRRSGLAKVVEAVKDNPGRGFVQIADFKPYAPSYGAPAAFLAAPIYNGPHLIGILAVQLPIDRINQVLSGNQDWSQEGLGRTGQVYAVGSDLLMRSDSRLLLENSEKYIQQLSQTNISDQTIDLIKKLKTSVLLQPIDTQASNLALNGESGTEVITNYRGMTVISSYAPLRIDGLDWGLITEIERGEAFGSIYAFQIYFGILSVILLLLISLLANWLGQNAVAPIKKLTNAVRQLQAGSDIALETNREDELGELQAAFKDLAVEINSQQAVLTQKEQENATLLANNLPPKAIAQWQQGQQQITDSVAKATILHGRIVGLSTLSQQKLTTEISSILNQLIAECDRYTLQYGLEKQNTIWDDYVAVCGLSESHLDQSQRTLNLALKMIEAVAQINQKFQVDLAWRIGIHSGKISAGIVGGEKFAYKLWGETANIVTNLNTKGLSNSIIITKAVKDRLSDQYLFVASEDITLENDQKVATWTLEQNLANSNQINQDIPLTKELI